MALSYFLMTVKLKLLFLIEHLKLGSDLKNS